MPNTVDIRDAKWLVHLLRVAHGYFLACPAGSLFPPSKFPHKIILKFVRFGMSPLASWTGYGELGL